MPESKDKMGIVRHVAEIIIDELKLEDITPDTFNPEMDLVDELGIDSMDLATIALVLQDEYRVTIDEDDYPTLKTFVSSPNILRRNCLSDINAMKQRGMPVNNNVATESSKPKFSDLLAHPDVKARWEKVRKYFFLRESTYDMSNRCNIRCDGCYYYEGEKQFAREVSDVEAWRELMRAEKARGITYVVLAGAEPSLVPALLEVCYQEMPLGSIATNGFKKIPESVGYKLHVSVWGNDETSLKSGRRKPLKNRLKLRKRSAGGFCLYVYAGQY